MSEEEESNNENEENEDEEDNEEGEEKEDDENDDEEGEGEENEDEEGEEGENEEGEEKEDDEEGEEEEDDEDDKKKKKGKKKDKKKEETKKENAEQPPQSSKFTEDKLLPSKEIKMDLNLNSSNSNNIYFNGNDITLANIAPPKKTTLQLLSEISSDMDMLSSHLEEVLPSPNPIKYNIDYPIINPKLDSLSYSSPINMDNQDLEIKKLIEKANNMTNNSILGNKNKTNKTEIYKKYFTENIPPSNVHVLRSVSQWSAGVKKTENSILNAYYDLIKKAKHYIYIENQFFVSKSWNKEERENNGNSISDEVSNEIAFYIRKRIEKAYKKKENFKVYIFIPLLPGFKGEPQESSTLKIILKHTYAGISRNHGLSLIEQLEKIMGNEWKNYIGFFSLRNHALVNNVPKTEIIYIHSKLMIIDDKTVLIGSANINDRSMLGDRDSELAVIINEKKELKNKKTGKKFIMNGKSNYNATTFAVEFRKALMAEHLGINQNDSILDDPVSNQLFSLFLERARKNTEIYHDLFACYPDDSFVSFQSLKDAQKMKKLEKAEDLLNKYNKLKEKIIGHIVEFPLFFLKEESLKTTIIYPENIYV